MDGKNQAFQEFSQSLVVFATATEAYGCSSVLLNLHTPSCWIGGHRWWWHPEVQADFRIMVLEASNVPKESGAPSLGRRPRVQVSGFVTWNHHFLEMMMVPFLTSFRQKRHLEWSFAWIFFIVHEGCPETNPIVPHVLWYWMIGFRQVQKFGGFLEEGGKGPTYTPTPLNSTEKCAASTRSPKSHSS